MRVAWPKKQLSTAVIFGCVSGLLGVLLALSPWGLQAEERYGLNWLFQLRGSVAPPDEVIVVAIDKGSSERLGITFDTSRWPRTLHARLLDGLRRAGAAVVAFDLHFRQARDGEDAVFAEAMSAAGNAVLLEFLEKDQPGMVRHANRLFPVTLQQRSLPTPVLAAAAAGSGPFTLPKVPDRVSRFWTFDQNAGGAPSLPCVALLHYAEDGYARLLRESAATAPRAAGAPTPPPSLAQFVSGQPPAAAAAVLRELMAAANEAPAAEGPSTRDRAALTAVLDLLHAPSSRYLNFYGPPSTLTTLSYADALHLLESGLADAWFAGKAVFVGVSSSEQWHLRDEHRTVFSDPVTGLDLSGIEIMATGFANLLERSSIRPLVQTGAAINILLWGLLIGLLAGLLRPLQAVLWVAGAAACYLVIAVHLFATHHTWAPVFVPLAVLAPGMLFLASLWHYREARADLSRIRTTFGHFLPPATVDRLVQEGFAPLKDRRTVFGACLMTDAQGYTSVAERLPSEQLVDVINGYMQAIIEPVRRLGGEVSDIKGDSLLAIWASRQDELAIRTAACRALGEIQRAVDGWNAHNPYGVALPTRIGLHCGRMTLASVGAAGHYERRAVGDIVNTASRLEQLSKELGTRALVSAATIEGVDGIATRCLGRFTLKGRSRPLEVHEYLGWDGTARAGQCPQRSVRGCRTGPTAARSDP